MKENEKAGFYGTEPSDSNRITRDYFDSLLIETRYLDAVLPSTKLELFGESFDTPIMTAALSHLNSTCENGMVQYAKAAKICNAVHWVGMGEESELDDIIKSGAKTIKIIKPHEDDEVIYRKIEHAIKAGAFAVGMDIDHSFSGDGKYDNVMGLQMRSKSKKDLEEYIRASSVPFIIKGILSVSDAVKCVEAGAKGIVVSHHHGIMKYSVPPLMVLPEIVKSVNGKAAIFVDCGIESGIDAFKALALGATAVPVGRELMKPLKNGAEAVAERIKEMTGELASIMARTGMKTLSDMNDSVIWKRNF